MDDDGELVRQALAGRTLAYERLVRRYGARVLAVCHARVGGRGQAAEDLAQETLLRGLAALPTLHEPDRFAAWICGIATRTCLDWLKSAQRTEVSYSSLADGADVPAQGDGHDGVEQREETGRLLAEVERLPEPCRQVVMMYYYDDVTYQQIAETLGVSAATVNARLTKARALLRERLGETDKVRR